MNDGLCNWITLVVALVLTCGCGPPDLASNGGNGAADGVEGEHKSGHIHEGDDALIWRRTDIEHEGHTISLGHHGEHLYAAHSAEPAVMISKNGEPVANAKVFVTLLDAAGKEIITAEQATVYEPQTEDESAHYAQARVKLPMDATELMLRYRIEWPAAGEFSQDVVVQISKH